LIRRSLAAWAATALACVSVDCAWVTDLGANGYTLTDSGVHASGCTSAAECDGGAICCVTSLSPVTMSCQTTCAALPDFGAVQICSSDGECAAGMCAQQNCPIGTISACGTVAGCNGSIEDDAEARPDTSVSTVITPIDASATITD
jgi:hypothetical protein